MRKPERTKNRSTPVHPYRKRVKLQTGEGASAEPPTARWFPITRTIAAVRSASSEGKVPGGGTKSDRSARPGHRSPAPPTPLVLSPTPAGEGGWPPSPAQIPRGGEPGHRRLPDGAAARDPEPRPQARSKRRT